MQQYANMTLLLMLIAASAVVTAYQIESLDESNILTIQNVTEESREVFSPILPTISQPGELEPSNGTLNREDFLQVLRNIATQRALQKVLRALGPRFEESLPSRPTSTSFTSADADLALAAEFCPYRYKTCSNRAYYPSCEIPPHTNAQMWERQFSLFFQITSDTLLSHRSDIINATLRLYKNISLPLTNPITLIVTLHVYRRSLRRNRDLGVNVSSVRIKSDYIGWVFIDADKIVRNLWKKSNHGAKISVQTEANVPWNIPDLFVKMDCQASNDSLGPLPFESELNNVTQQRYPALKLRIAMQERQEVDAGYRMFLPLYNQPRRTQPQSRFASNIRRRSYHRRNRQYWNNLRRNRVHHQLNNNNNNNSSFNHDRQHHSAATQEYRPHNNLNQIINQRHYTSDKRQIVTTHHNTGSRSSPNDIIEYDQYDTGNNYVSESSTNNWITSNDHGNQGLHNSFVNRRQQPRHNDDHPAPPLNVHPNSNLNSNGFMSDDQYYDHRPHRQEFVNDTPRQYSNEYHDNSTSRREIDDRSNDYIPGEQKNRNFNINHSSLEMNSNKQHRRLSKREHHQVNYDITDDDYFYNDYNSYIGHSTEDSIPHHQHRHVNNRNLGENINNYNRIEHSRSHNHRYRDCRHHHGDNRRHRQQHRHHNHHHRNRTITREHSIHTANTQRHFNSPEDLVKPAHTSGANIIVIHNDGNENTEGITS